MTASSNRVLVTLAATALIAVGVAGCGGGDDDPPNTGDPTPPDPNPPAAIALDNALGMGINQSVPPTLDKSGAPADGSGFMESADAAIDGIAGWDHTAYVLENMASGMTPASTETLVVYGNTDYETETAFADAYPFDVDGDSDTMPDSIDVADYDPSLVGGANLPDTVSADGTFPGTFDGASGEYTCTENSGCELRPADFSGNVASIVGNMHFTPDAGETVPVPVPDYIYFGYWIQEGTDGNGDPEFEVAGIVGGELPSNISDVQSLEGEAEYAGAATGLFVRRWTNSNGEVVRRRSGRFTADAALTAYFGGPTVAAVSHYMIEGMISNFTEGGRAVDPSWRLELGSTGFDSGSSVTNGVFVGPTQDVDAAGNGIADTTGGGDWEGQFFGAVEVDANSMTDGNQSTLPSAVVGAFEGEFTNGVVVGAFGAENED